MHSELIQDSYRIHWEFIQNSFRTNSEIFQNSFRIHSESNQNSLNSFRIELDVCQNVPNRLKKDSEPSTWDKVFPQYELVPLELAGRFGTARTHRTIQYRENATNKDPPPFGNILTGRISTARTLPSSTDRSRSTNQYCEKVTKMDPALSGNAHPTASAASG